MTMYGWIWCRLPGGTGTRLVLAALLMITAAFFLWFVVYPWASVHLPVDQPGVG
jgi:hypothetical protein